MDIDEKAVNKPKTIDEAAVFIIAEMSEEDNKVVRETEKYKLIQYHFTRGMDIRNGIGPQAADSEIMKSSECFYPDNCSMMVIETFRNQLRRKK